MKAIGFLTPYTGDNLGDGAIQDAVIHNIRVRWPNARIMGFTLSPDQTAALHGVPCQPLTNLSIRYYNRGVLERHRGQASRQPSPRAGDSLFKRMLKSVPLAFHFARWCYHCLERIAQAMQVAVLHVRHTAREVGELPQSYRLVSGFDLLIVSGGGQIDDLWGGAFGHPYALLKWALLARISRTPFVLLSVGVGELNSRTSRFFTRYALQLAAYRSYRDTGSKRLLAAMTLTASDPVCPDLAFSYPVPAGARSPAGRGARLSIGVNPISYLRAGSWPVSSASLHEQYLKTLASFIESVLQEGHRIVLFPGDRGDHHVIGELSRTLRESLDEDLLARLSIPKVSNAADLFRLLRSLDLVVASRLHSVILSHLACTPVMAISYERKVKVQMDAFAQSAYCLDIHRIDLTSLRLTFAALREHRKDVQDTLLEKSREANAAIQRQYDDVLLRNWQLPGR